MSTAFDAASVILPQGSGYKAGKLYGWRPDVKELQDIDVVRAAATNVASRVNSSGVREFVGANVPRWDWSEGGSCPSLLVEPQRTNLFDQDLSGSGVATQVVTVVDGTEYTVSAEGSGSLALTGAGTGTVTEGSPVTFTADGTSLTCTLTGSLDYAQVEEGDFATSIIYTSGSTATRNADVISKDGIASLIGQTEGTLYVEASVFDNIEVPTISIGDGTTNNRIGIRTSSNKLSFIAVVNGSVLNSGAGSQTVTNNIFFKAALRYKTNDFACYKDGVISLTSTGSTANFSGSKFAFDGQSGFPFYGRIRALAWLKEALTNDELESLTS